MFRIGSGYVACNAAGRRKSDNQLRQEVEEEEEDGVRVMAAVVVYDDCEVASKRSSENFMVLGVEGSWCRLKRRVTWKQTHSHAYV